MTNLLLSKKLEKLNELLDIMIERAENNVFTTGQKRTISERVAILEKTLEVKLKEMEAQSDINNIPLSENK
jgi:hypothetical protein